MFVAVSFVAHACYLLSLAIFSPGIPELSVIILLTEVIPAGVLVAQMLMQWLNVTVAGKTDSASTKDDSEGAYFHESHSDIM